MITYPCSKRDPNCLTHRGLTPCDPVISYWWFNARLQYLHCYPDSKVHGANMRPTWVLRPQMGPMNFAIWVMHQRCCSLALNHRYGVIEHDQHYFDGILPKGPYPPCLRMADRALLAGYPRFQVTAGHLCGVRPLPESELNYCQLDPSEETSMKF